MKKGLIHIILLFMLFQAYSNELQIDTSHWNKSMLNIDSLVKEESQDRLDSLKELLQNQFNDVNYKKWKVRSYQNIAFFYSKRKDKLKALEYFNKAYVLSDSLNFTRLLMLSSYDIANQYIYDLDSLGGLYLKRALDIAKSQDNYSMLVDCYQLFAFYYSSRANVEKDTSLFSKSLDYHSLTEPLFELIDSSMRKEKESAYFMLKATIFLSDIYPKQNKLEGLYLLKKAEKISKKPKAAIKINIGDCYEKLDLLDSALHYYAAGKRLAIKEKDIYKIGIANISLSEVYKKKKQAKPALMYLSLYNNLEDSIDSLFFTEDLARLKQAQLYLKKKLEKDVEHDQEIKEQKRKTYIYALVFLVAICFIGIMLIGQKRQRKLSVQLDLENQELEIQGKALDYKNKDIADSIEYAIKIQNAISITDQDFTRILGKAFLLFIPKEKVSGDFYFAYEAKNGKKLIAVADSKFHGLPGAFMGMLGASLLREVINQSEDLLASDVLNSMSESIQRALRSNSESLFKGIELSVCIIDSKQNTLNFSGGNMSAYHVRDGQLKELKGDRSIIGYGYDLSHKFNDYYLDLEAGDNVYLFTDGFVDQFGGLHGKKYKSAKFRNKLCAIHKLKMEQQKKELLREFKEWKGTEEQIDDISIIGLRV